jgi:Protein of unknown function (DUF1580)
MQTSDSLYIGPDRLKNLIPLNKVPNFLPPLRNDKPINLATIYRWTNKGCGGVELRYAMMGTTRCTTLEWLAEFVNKSTGQQNESPVVPLPASPKKSRAADDDTDRRLDQMYKKADTKKSGNRKVAGVR